MPNTCPNPLRSFPARHRSGRSASRSALLAALLAGGLAVATTARPNAPRPACGATPSPETVVSRLNATRAHGAVCQAAAPPSVATPLRWSADLAAVAEAQSRDMAAQRRMSHRDSRNRSLPERLDANGYRFSAAAENVAVGYSSLDAVVEAWLASEGHCVNLMNTKVLELGLACSDSGDDAAPAADAAAGRYWTLVLGAPPRAR